MKVILGLSGTVASVLGAKLYDAIVAIGHEVRVIMTERAKYFLPYPPLAMKDRVYDDQCEWYHGEYHKGDDIPHIILSDWADAMVLIASMDIISKIAHGQADDLLTSTIAAWPNRGLCGEQFINGERTWGPRFTAIKPIIVAPAMHPRMWTNPLTKRNLAQIESVYNTFVVQPQTKRLACGAEGIGALADISNITRKLEIVLHKYRLWNG